MVSLRPCYVSEGQKVKVMQAYTSLTAKAIGLILFSLASTNKTKKKLNYLSFPKSILTNMNPNSRQVTTCISSADRLCLSHTESILFFLFFLLRNGRVRGQGVRGGVWICFLVKFSLKPNPKRLHPNVHTLFFFQR